MESKSLSFEKLSLEHLPQLSFVMQDALHMKYSVQLLTDDDCRQYIKKFASQWETYGFGCWAIFEKSTSQLVGWGGVVVDEEQWGPELIYYISPDRCGLGYASECAEFSVRFAQQKLKLSKLVAFAHPENIASNRVLIRSGFAYLKYIKILNRNYYEQPFI